MTTSGNTDFIQTRNEIIKEALLKCRVAAEGEPVSAEMMATGQRNLNSIMKFWQTQGYHLWKIKEGVLFTEPGKYKYCLGNGKDRVVADFKENRTLYQIYEGNKEFYLQWEEMPIVGDEIGIVLNSSCIFWTKVASVEDKKVTVENYIPSCVGCGAKVFYYNQTLGRPLKIMQARRADVWGTEIDMRLLEREQYFKLVNKESCSTPLNFYYDPQLPDGFLYLYPAPATNGWMIKFTYQQPFDIFEASKNTADISEEWIEPLTWELAYRMAPNYGLPLEEREWLKQQAIETLEQAKNFDAEEGSFYLQYGYNRGAY